MFKNIKILLNCEQYNSTEMYLNVAWKQWHTSYQEQFV